MRSDGPEVVVMKDEHGALVLFPSRIHLVGRCFWTCPDPGFETVDAAGFE